MGPAFALLEIDGLPRGTRAHDAALKRAAVDVCAMAPVSGGKVVLVLSGPVAECEEAYRAAMDASASALLDHVWLPGPVAAVASALRSGEWRTVPIEAAAAMVVGELRTVVRTVAVVDAVLKGSRVELERLHLASGYGGRGYFIVAGEHADAEAALELVTAHGGDALHDAELIAQPHAALRGAMLWRPWPADPSRSE